MEINLQKFFPLMSFAISYIQDQMAGAFPQPGPLVRVSKISDRNRTCQSGRETPHLDVQPMPTTQQMPFSGRGNVPLLGHSVKKFRRPAVLQVSIEGLTEAKLKLSQFLQCLTSNLVSVIKQSV